MKRLTSSAAVFVPSLNQGVAFLCASILRQLTAAVGVADTITQISVAGSQSCGRRHSKDRRVRATRAGRRLAGSLPLAHAVVRPFFRSRVTVTVTLSSHWHSASARTRMPKVRCVITYRGYCTCLWIGYMSCAWPTYENNRGVPRKAME